jgi:hypothetical protein
MMITLDRYSHVTQNLQDGYEDLRDDVRFLERVGYDSAWLARSGRAHRAARDGGMDNPLRVGGQYRADSSRDAGHERRPSSSTGTFGAN